MILRDADDSMPYATPSTDRDLPSDDRDTARLVAEEMIFHHSRLGIVTEAIHGRWTPEQLATVAKAVLRYVPGGVPAAPEHIASGPQDRTMPIGSGPMAMPARVVPTPPPLRAGVLAAFDDMAALERIDLDEDASDGVCEESDDGTTRRAGNLGLTRILDLGLAAELNLDDKTRR